MGLGGGHFMLVYIKALNSSFAIDSRETAPGGSSQNMFVKKPGSSVRGVLLIRIYSLVALSLCNLHKQAFKKILKKHY